MSWKLNYKNMSHAAIHILVKHKGYRSDEYSIFEDNSEYPDSNAILDYEINKLERTDIMETLHKIYNIKPNDYFSAAAADSIISSILGTNFYYLIWVNANKTQVLRYTKDPDSIYQIDFKKNPLAVVNDQGERGVLIACPQNL